MKHVHSRVILSRVILKSSSASGSPDAVLSLHPAGFVSSQPIVVHERCESNLRQRPSLVLFLILHFMDVRDWRLLRVTGTIAFVVPVLPAFVAPVASESAVLLVVLTPYDQQGVLSFCRL